MANQRSGMSLIVKRITRITVSLIFLYGVYITLHGHLAPGGGFVGGVIMALSFIHLVLAFGRKQINQRLINEGVASFAEALGIFAFLLLAMAGFFGGYFFLNFLSKGKPFSLFSAGIIPLANLAIFFKVGAGLFSIFFLLAIWRMDEEAPLKKTKE